MPRELSIEPDNLYVRNSISLLKFQRKTFCEQRTFVEIVFDHVSIIVSF